MAAFGRMAGQAEAKLSGEEATPYSHSAIVRFFNGRVSLQLATAVAEMTGIPVVRQDVQKPLLAMWGELGAELAGLDERLLLDIAVDLRVLIDQLRKVKQKTGPTQ